MQVSLVIPIRNETASIAALLDSIRLQTKSPDEILLVDGGSTDGTIDLAKQLVADDSRYRIIDAGPATPGRGRNVGIEAAGHDWIALTDAGIRLEPTWLQRLVEPVERQPDLDVVYGNYEPIAETAFAQYAVLAYVPAKETCPGGRIRGRSTASMLIRRATWALVGGFPDLRAAEDLIFMERIEQSGCRIGWAPQATVWWQIQPTLARTFNRFVLYSKHNVWAGRQRYWHHGVARQYLVAGLILLLALAWSPWWLLVLWASLVARIGRTLWLRREDHSLGWLFNPVRWMAVGFILLAIDLATFVGWLQAIRTRSPAPGPLPAPHSARTG